MTGFKQLDNPEALLPGNEHELKSGWAYVLQPDAYIWGKRHNDRWEWSCTPDWDSAYEVRQFDGQTDVLLWKSDGRWCGRQATIDDCDGFESLWSRTEAREDGLEIKADFVNVKSKTGQEWTLPKGKLKVKHVYETLETGAVRVCTTLLLGFEEE